MTRLALFLTDHHARPLALLIHRLAHRHPADDDCPRCIDDMR